MARERSIALGFAAGLLLVAGLSVLAWREVIRLRTAADSVEHDWNVTLQIDEIIASVDTVQRSTRGYLLTALPQFREPADRALAQLHRQVEALADLERDDAAELRAVLALREQIQVFSVYQRANVAVRDREGLQAAAARVATGRGEALTNATLATLDRMMARERGDLLRLQALRASRAEATTVTVGAGSVLAFLLVLGSSLLQRRELRRRREAEMRFRTMVEAAPDAALIIDAQGRIVLANRRAQALLGPLPGSLVGMSYEALAPERLRGDYRSVLAAYLSDGAARPGTQGQAFVALGKDGKELPVEVSLSPMRIDGERVLLALVRDVTQARSLQRELQRYKAEAEDLYQNAPCGYHSLDADGVIVRMNDTGLRWLGRAREEVIGRMRLTDMMTEASQQLFAQRFPSFLASGEIHDADFDFVRKDGTTFSARASATAVRDEDGRIVRSRSILVDETARKQAEAERERLIAELQQVLSHVRQLQGLLPMCAWCKKIRDDQGTYQTLERYLTDHSEARITHGICPDCAARLGDE